MNIGFIPAVDSLPQAFFHISPKITAHNKLYSTVHGAKYGSDFTKIGSITFEVRQLYLCSYSWLVIWKVFEFMNCESTSERDMLSLAACMRRLLADLKMSCWVSSMRTKSHSHRFVAIICIRPNLAITLLFCTSMNYKWN